MSFVLHWSFAMAIESRHPNISCVQAPTDVTSLCAYKVPTPSLTRPIVVLTMGRHNWVQSSLAHIFCIHPDRCLSSWFWLTNSQPFSLWILSYYKLNSIMECLFVPYIVVLCHYSLGHCDSNLIALWCHHKSWGGFVYHNRILSEKVAWFDDKYKSQMPSIFICTSITVQDQPRGIGFPHKFVRNHKVIFSVRHIEYSLDSYLTVSRLYIFYNVCLIGDYFTLTAVHVDLTYTVISQRHLSFGIS